VHLPFLDESVPVSREEFEHLAEPVIARTVTVTRAAVRSAGIGPQDVGGIFLVGGSSRVPLVATLLHRAFELPPTVLEQPELVVAEGALSRLDAHEEHTPAGVTMTLPVPETETESEPPTQRIPAKGTARPVVPAAPSVPASVPENPGLRHERPPVRRHLADPWGVAAAAVLGILAGAVAAAADAGALPAIGAAVVVAVLVYAVRVVLGLAFDH
jgi:hypothetical protein